MEAPIDVSKLIAQRLWLHHCMSEAARYCLETNLEPDAIELQRQLQASAPELIERVCDHRNQVQKGTVTGTLPSGEDRGYHIYQNIVRTFARNAVDRAVKAGK